MADNAASAEVDEDGCSQVKTQLKRKAGSYHLSDIFAGRPPEDEAVMWPLWPESADETSGSSCLTEKKYHSRNSIEHEHTHVTESSLPRPNKQTHVHAFASSSQRMESGTPLVFHHHPTQSFGGGDTSLTENNSPSGRTRQASPSWPLPSADSTLKTAFSFASNGSDLSVSQFPLPPHESGPSAANTSQDSSKKTFGPSTPTIYHTRGASFEFLNPRDSLCLERIEAPSGHFTKSADYAEILKQQLSYDSFFKSSQLLDTNLLRTTMDLSRTYSASPRPLFDDLHTAYSSITSRAAHKPEGLTKNKADNALPLTPHAVRDTKKAFDIQPISTDDSADGLRPVRPLPTLSRKKRMSNLWRSRRSNESSGGRDFDSDPGTEQSGSTLGDQIISHPSEKIEFRRSVSEAELRRSKSAHEPASTFRPLTPTQSSLFSLLNLDPSSPESKMKKMIERDESSDALLSAYQYSFSDEALAENNRSESTANVPAIQLEPPKEDSAVYSANSTIGDILEDYHRADDSCTVPEEFLVDDDTRALTPPWPHSSHTSSGIAYISDDHNDHCNNGECRLKESPLHIMRDVRLATAQALKVLPSAVPSRPLPGNPSSVKAQGTHNTSPWRFSSPIASSSRLSSYGDTGNLLRQSEEAEPAEVGRGTGGSKISLQRDLFSSSESLLSPLARPRRANDAASPTNTNAMPSNFVIRDEVDSMITRDIRHLSGISGISGLSGSIYVLRTSSDGLGDFECTAEGSATLNKAGGQSGQQGGTGINYVPQVAAFSQRSVKAGVHRLPSSDSLDRHRSIEEQSNVSLSTRSSSSHFDIFNDQGGTIDENTDQDWETLPETRDTRNTFMTGSSWEDYSSVDSSNNLSVTNIRRKDSHYKFADRTSTPRVSEDSALFPTNNYYPGNGFPHRNAGSGPSTGVYQYRHPSPLSPSHENPFTSSPPALIPSGSKSASPDSTNEAATLFADANLARASTYNSPYQWHRKNLSVVYEATAETSGTGTPTRKQFTNVRSDQDFSPGRDIHSYTSSAVLGSEPGPELSSEAVHGSPYDLLDNTKNHRPYKLTGTDVTLVKKLRQNDPRMASSPLSDSNSFAKYTILGPRLNVTGTPNGTGMRETGSSVVTSSSPYAFQSSPPVTVTPPSSPPIAQGSALTPQGLDNHGSESNSPLAGYDKNKESSRDQLVVPGSFVSATRKQTGPRGRPAVAGQTKLMSLGLPNEDYNPITTPRKVFFERGPYSLPFGRPDYSTESALTRFQIDEFSLKERYRSPSSRNSATKSRKTAISWIAFAICASFPPLLVVYGLGYLDAGVAYLTKGEIRHFGRRPKIIAKWLGAILTIAIVGAIVIFWIVIKTVPNTFPKA